MMLTFFTFLLHNNGYGWMRGTLKRRYLNRINSKRKNIFIYPITGVDSYYGQYCFNGAFRITFNVRVRI